MFEVENKIKINDKWFFKNTGVYLLHRSYEKDHEKGRPAILLKYKAQTSLIWWGTHKKEKASDEEPLVINFGKKTYFYSKGIEKVENETLKERWINYKTNDVYELNEEQHKELIGTFSKFINEKDPYQIIALLELEQQALKKENEMLQKENQLLKQERKLEDYELEFELE